MLSGGLLNVNFNHNGSGHQGAANVTSIPVTVRRYILRAKFFGLYGVRKRKKEKKRKRKNERKRKSTSLTLKARDLVSLKGGRDKLQLPPLTGCAAHASLNWSSGETSIFLFSNNFLINAV